MHFCCLFRSVTVTLLFLIESIKVIYSCFYANTFPPIGALHERNASLPSINILVSVTVTVSSCFCSCPFHCVPECLLWFPFLSLCLGPFPSDPAPITVPVSLFLVLSLSMPLSLLLTLSLYPCVPVSSPPGPFPLHSILLYSVLSPLPIHLRATIP